MINSFNNEWDERARWMGVKFLRKGFQPRPYSRKRREDGSHLPIHEQSEEAAKYLAEVQWKNDGKNKWKDIDFDKIFENLNYNNSPPLWWSSKKQLRD